MDSSHRRVKAAPLDEAIGCRIMKTVSLRMALHLAILAIVLLATGRADARDTAAVSNPSRAGEN